MDTVRQYILSVICIAVVCGVLQMLIPKGTAAALFKVISGLAVTITVLSPIVNEQMLQWDYSFEHMVSDGTIAASDGQRAAGDLLKQHIREDTEAYILSKASDWGASIVVNIELASEYPNAPVAATMKGNISPYAKKQLSASLTGDLGIPEEKQIWIS